MGTLNLVQTSANMVIVCALSLSLSLTSCRHYQAQSDTGSSRTSDAAALLLELVTIFFFFFPHWGTSRNCPCRRIIGEKEFHENLGGGGGGVGVLSGVYINPVATQSSAVAPSSKHLTERTPPDHPLSANPG